MKKTIYLHSLITLSLGSIFLGSCSDKESAQQADWMNTDTIPGKVVKDERGNEWIWHHNSLSNMMMGYWLINSMGNQSRYYPSTRQYRDDKDESASPITRPAYVSSSPVKKAEGRLTTTPSTVAPINRAATHNGYIASPRTLHPVKAKSSRGGFGRSGSHHSFGS